MSVPCQIAAGSTLLFSETRVSYPATQYALTFALNIQGTAVTGITSAAAGNDYAVTAPAIATALWVPGRYFWSETFTKISDNTVYSGCRGQLSVTPNYSATAARIASQVQLDTLDSAIALVVANPYQSTNFNGQAFTGRNLRELFDMRDRLQARVYADLRSMGLTTLGGAQTIVTRFYP